MATKKATSKRLAVKNPTPEQVQDALEGLEITAAQRSQAVSAFAGFGMGADEKHEEMVKLYVGLRSLKDPQNTGEGRINKKLVETWRHKVEISVSRKSIFYLVPKAVKPDLPADMKKKHGAVALQFLVVPSDVMKFPKEIDMWVVSGSFPKFDLEPVVEEAELNLKRSWKPPKGGMPRLDAAIADGKTTATLADEDVTPPKLDAIAAAAVARSPAPSADLAAQEEEDAAVQEMLNEAKGAVQSRRLFSPSTKLSPEYMDFWVDQFLDHVSRLKKTRGGVSEQEFTASLGPSCSRFLPDIVTWLLQEKEWVPVRGFAENVQDRVKDFGYLVPPLLQVIMDMAMKEAQGVVDLDSVKQLGKLQYRSALFLSQMYRACNAHGRVATCERTLRGGKPLAGKDISALQALLGETPEDDEGARGHLEFAVESFRGHADDKARLAWIAEDFSRVALLSDWEPGRPWCCVGPLVGDAAQMKSAALGTITKAAEFFRDHAELIDLIPNKARKDPLKDYRKIQARGAAHPIQNL
ncbi:unnamed protein product, partial [Prorocentrum cordatum]